MRRSATILWLGLTLALCGCGGLGKLDWTTFGRGSWQRPADVVRTLEIRTGDRVADLGAGEGFFVPYLADAVGLEGRVYAVEVDAERISELEARFRDERDNVEIVRGRLDDPEPSPAQPASTNSGDDQARSSLGVVQSSEGSVR